MLFWLNLQSDSVCIIQNMKESYCNIMIILLLLLGVGRGDNVAIIIFDTLVS